MRKYKGKHLKEEDERKKILTTSVKVVWFILLNACGWIWCSYLLAYLQRGDIAEELSKVALTAIVAVVLGYYGKALTENISKHNTWPDKKPANPMVITETVTEVQNTTGVNLNDLSAVSGIFSEPEEEEEEEDPLSALSVTAITMDCCADDFKL